MIIKAESIQENQKVVNIRKLLQPFMNEQMHVVPEGLNWIFITLDETDDYLTVFLYDKNEKVIDQVKGFNSVSDCWEYAKKVVVEAGLTVDAIDRDVSDIA